MFKAVSQNMNVPNLSKKKKKKFWDQSTMKPKADKSLVPNCFCNENIEQRKETQFHVN